MQQTMNELNFYSNLLKFTSFLHQYCVQWKSKVCAYWSKWCTTKEFITFRWKRIKFMKMFYLILCVHSTCWWQSEYCRYCIFTKEMKNSVSTFWAVGRDLYYNSRWIFFSVAVIRVILYVWHFEYLRKYLSWIWDFV